MTEQDSARWREGPGSARRTDAIILCIGTVVTAAVAYRFRAERPPVLLLFCVSTCLYLTARWVRHIRPHYYTVFDTLSTMVVGAALYALLASL
jgi:hypothetical protein